MTIWGILSHWCTCSCLMYVPAVGARVQAANVWSSARPVRHDKKGAFPLSKFFWKMDHLLGLLNAHRFPTSTRVLSCKRAAIADSQTLVSDQMAYHFQSLGDSICSSKTLVRCWITSQLFFVINLIASLEEKCQICWPNYLIIIVLIVGFGRWRSKFSVKPLRTYMHTYMCSDLGHSLYILPVYFLHCRWTWLNRQKLFADYSSDQKLKLRNSSISSWESLATIQLGILNRVYMKNLSNPFVEFLLLFLIYVVNG